MKLTANLSMLFTEHPFVDRFAAARDAGFEHVEVQFPYELGVSELQRAIRNAGVTLVLFNVPAGDLLQGGDGLACVAGKRGAQRDALSLACEYASVLSPRCVNLLAGRVPEGVDVGPCRGAFAESLAMATEHLEKLGVTVTVEALNGYDVPRFLLQTHDQALSALRDSTARVQYDLYHQARMGRNVVADLERDARLLGHVQFADVPGRGEPGSGSLDWTRIFSAIARSPYDGFVGAEYRPTTTTDASFGWLGSARNAGTLG